MIRTRRLLQFAFPALALALTAGEAAAATITIGPYIREIQQDGAVIAWETDVAAAGAVAVGETADLGQAIPAVTDGTRHQARVAGLAPATLRHYRVVVDGEPAGRAGTFLTLPPDDRPFTFLVYGDSRSDPDAHRLVVSRMLEHPADFVVNTGDLVSQGDHEDEWVLFFEILKDLVGDTLLLANVGNHDLESVSPPSRFVKRLGGFAPGGGVTTWRRFDHGATRFLLLDNFDQIVADMECFMRTGSFTLCINATQTAWLQGELDAAAQDPTVRHVFIVVHEGPYSSKPDRVGSADLRSWLNRFGAAKVRAILSGHDHYYEHGKSANGLDYIITGGGGAPLYETVPEVEAGEPPHEILTSTSVYHFLRVTVDGDAIDVTVFNADGSEMESFGIPVPAACASPADCSTGKAGICEGAWACPAGECTWACKPPPECEIPEECEWRDPGDCDGSWACEDERCLWACDPPPEEDTGNNGGDLGTTADPGPATDSGPMAPPDAGPNDPGTAATADTVVATDSTTPDAGPAEPPAKKSGGCAAGPVAGFPWWMLMGLAAVAFRRKL